MSVSISFPAMIADRIGAGRVDVHGGTVGEALHALTARYPQLAGLLWERPGELNDFLVLFLNGEHLAAAQALQTPLAAGDELMIVGAAEGG
jgi:molybdopterin converting factor small subunit